jgi:NAD(P)-dependent dehydrogenase (short-subunit alcohol dehydrogenase family)
MATALVTGAARRLGREIALRLAGEGWDVAVHYLSSEDDALRLKADVEGMGRRCGLVRADLAVEADVQGIIGRAEASVGPVRVLVNCASVFEDDRIDTATRESWDRHLNTNLRAPFVLSQCFAARVGKDEHGCIVNLIDQSILRLTPQFMSYTVSKAGLWTLTQTMAQALAPRIRVNAVAPGPSLKASHQSQANFDRQVQSTLLRRPSGPEQIAAAVSYLVAATSVTGQMIAVDSGQHLTWSASDFVE